MLNHKCPDCDGKLKKTGNVYTCKKCGKQYAIESKMIAISGEVEPVTRVQTTSLSPQVTSNDQIWKDASIEETIGLETTRVQLSRDQINRLSPIVDPLILQALEDVLPKSVLDKLKETGIVGPAYDLICKLPTLFGSDSAQAFIPLAQIAGATQPSLAVLLSLGSCIMTELHLQQIDSKLDAILENLGAVKGFLEAGYQGKLAAVTSELSKLVKYRGELIRDEVQRQNALIELNDVRSMSISLLVQANKIIEEIAQRTSEHYKKYGDWIYDAQHWCDTQIDLLNALYQIAALDYWLSMGSKTLEFCTLGLSDRADEICRTREDLRVWHERMMKDTAVKYIPNDQRRYRKKFRRLDHIVKHGQYVWLSSDLCDILDKQRAHFDLRVPNLDIQGQKEVQLVAHKGQVYCLPGR